MALILKHSLAATLPPLALLMLNLFLTEAQVGVCYGRLADNLPSAECVVQLYKEYNITRMRIFEPDHDTLDALRGSNIELVIGVDHNELVSIGTDETAAFTWVKTNILPYANDVKFRYIVVGNEINYTTDVDRSKALLPGMRNILYALRSTYCASNIKITTSIATDLLTNTEIPSNGAFKEDAKPFIIPIIKFLRDHESPLLVNIYPYFAYKNDPNNISLDYFLFTANRIVVKDPNNGLEYQNLFDAMLDSVYAALDKVVTNELSEIDDYKKNGGLKHMVGVSETGASSGHSGHRANRGVYDNNMINSDYEYAGIYYQNVIKHVKNGSPRYPGEPIETYLFAMFDENKKEDDVERHFGIFTPDGQPKYQLNFNC